MSLFHSLTEGEQLLIRVLTILKDYKIDHITEDFINILHDGQLKTFCIDMKEEKKEEIPLSEVVSSSYFSSFRNMNGSVNEAADTTFDLVNLFLSALCKKMNGFYSISQRNNDVFVNLSVSNITADLFSGSDDCYALYEVGRRIRRLDEEELGTKVIEINDNYSNISRAVLRENTITLNFKFDVSDNMLKRMTEIITTFYNRENLRFFIKKKIEQFEGDE